MNAVQKYDLRLKKILLEHKLWILEEWLGRVRNGVRHPIAIEQALESEIKMIQEAREENKCDFCGQVKPVGRVYVYAGNKEKILENDRNANYFSIIYYCLDCGEPYLPELTQP